jgi:hypothetical protein
VGDVVKTLDYFAPEIYDRNLEEVCEQFAPASRGGVSRMKASLFSGDYKARRDELRALHMAGG